VESALTLPLALFMVLGLLQLFMLLQARIMAQYAAYKAVRAGSLNYAECGPMEDAAIAAFLPTITAFPTTTPALAAASFAAEFGARSNNRYNDDGFTGPIVEIVRENPLAGSLNALPGAYDYDFDAPQAVLNDNTARLEARFIFWYRLKIPFADWVMGRMFLAYFGIKAFKSGNPLMLTQKANWTGETTIFDEGDWPHGSITSNMSAAAAAGHYIFPIKVNAVMKMMTPAGAASFPNGQGCLP
jgi:hypothetical protein